ncbi:Enamine deaminase RidA, house cleaning of reactive enamine intermediates, YjgF/YER057c/UK114 family [Amycolatopsis arida]|uniref:Enamine deaminase RidA, house cleaning of reactive enamine intermediates, YjgF/YER057c/UK114 family n=1 Tax=Amycolatopsis arida TaxID=587909 RepID=A0A1I5TZY7_9PSEU|nr:RidA family protein [Amycolatopsis arida]TDX95883.1 enamine deaminase RidA (YjgF/YER057c/UK114 family) [Amycolatopsis arida]SFP88622.1 Enamine deaminase RidA, house cleaning of reactive enamine intermediates, YjgF/YER057c/UK114 family [Amycolatopsis arida]
MTTSPTEERLARLGLTLPEPPAAVAAFQPYVRAGATVYVSGQIATRDGGLVATGRLGAEVDLATGQEAARACALNVLAQLHAAAGSLDAVARLVKITVFVASDPAFTEQPRVADGASRLLLDVLGPAGEHARAAVGVAVLPQNTPIEVDATAVLEETGSNR